MKKLRILTFLAFIFTALISCGSFASNGNGNNANSDMNANNNVSNNNVNDTGSGSSFSPSQVKDIQKIVHDYLINNPKILVEVSQTLQKQQAEEAQKNAMAAIQKDKDALFNDPKTPTVGESNASIYIVEFFDYQCGHCKAMAPIVESIVKNNKNVKVIFKELPIFGGASRYAAKMALASVAQDKYYEFHNALFDAKGPLDKNIVLKIAKSVGINTSKLQQSAAAPWINNQLRANFRLAQSLKLVGTPAFIIANEQLTKFRFIPGATSEDDLNNQIKSVENE